MKTVCQKFTFTTNCEIYTLKNALMKLKILESLAGYFGFNKNYLCNDIRRVCLRKLKGFYRSLQVKEPWKK